MTRQFLAMNDYDIRTRMADEGRPPLKDVNEVWFDAVRPYFSGNLIVGRDPMEIW